MNNTKLKKQLQAFVRSKQKSPNKKPRTGFWPQIKMEVKFFKIEKIIERLSQKPNMDAYLIMQHDGKRDNLTMSNYDYITQSYVANIENEGQQ